MVVERVHTWLDKSGNGNHATQTVGNKQPKIGNENFSGLNVVDFDGVDDFFVLPSSMYGLTNGDDTTFVVVKQDAAANERVLTAAVSGASRYGMQFNGGNLRYYNSDFAGGVVASITETNTNLLTGFRDGTTQSISVNGATAVTNTSGSDEASVNQFNIGTEGNTSTEFLTGQIAEIVIFDFALTSEEIDEVNQELKFRWGLL